MAWWLGNVGTGLVIKNDACLLFMVVCPPPVSHLVLDEMICRRIPMEATHSWHRCLYKKFGRFIIGLALKLGFLTYPYVNSKNSII